MIFDRITPLPELSSLVKEIWVYENDDSTPEVQKIIPDGYSEIIIHYGDPYRIQMNTKWETQSQILFSSQISNYFHLENTGKSGVIGLKLHPTSFYELFQIDIAPMTNQVIPLENIIPNMIGAFKNIQEFSLNREDKVQIAQQWMLSQLENRESNKMREVVDKLLLQKGLIDIEHLSEQAQLSSRQLERTFKKVIGLTPKFYSRIIRFNYIFEVLKEHNDSWAKTALQSGYFDQSHFIKNFKEFTGEEPSKYGFDEINLANFFLKR